MRRSVVITALLGCIFISSSYAQYQGEALSKGYYIVVEAYRVGQEKHMTAYLEKLNQGGLHSKYGYDLSRNFYYISMSLFKKC
jgi:hypothetical protein